MATGATVSLVCLALAGTFGSMDRPPFRGVLTGIAGWVRRAASVIGVAIMKYRLYDIDRLISRTLAYAIITGLLVGVYAGLVLLTTQVLGSTRRWRWPPLRWPRRLCSAPCGGECSERSTGVQPGPV